MEDGIVILIGLLIAQIVLTGLSAYRWWKIDAGIKSTTELSAIPICNHKWRIENKDTILNAWSQLADDERSRTAPDAWLFRGVIATTYVCILCGAMRTELVANHNEPKS